MTPRPVVLYGASGTAVAAREFWRAGSLWSSGVPLCEVVGYIDDFRGDDSISIDGVPVMTLEKWRKRLPDVPCMIAIGDPHARRRLVARVKSAGGSFCSVYDSNGWISPDITVGEGTMIAPAPTYIGPLTTIGNHVMIMHFSVINHNCTIGDYVVICPSVNVSGQVVIEDEVFIGVGATIVNGSEQKPLRIGRGATVCAGAVVFRSVAAKTKVAGNPAQDLRSLFANRGRPPRPSAT